jgi:predicted DsbA family dithiol-disulfide isomerase
MRPITIQITSDFICPWCWIGHRNLKLGLAQLEHAPPVQRCYRPYELNPTMPVEGISRREYRTRKFGSWARSQELDAQVVAAGQQAGVLFNYDQVHITPSTRRAHRLMQLVQTDPITGNVDGLVDALFSAYFNAGRDIGAIDVLVDLAQSNGFDGDAVRAYLLSTAGEQEVAQDERAAQAQGIQGVPAFVIEGEFLSGAHPPAAFAQVVHALSARTILA